MAQAQYIQTGQAIDYTPSAAVDAGDVVVIGDILGISKLDIAADALGALALEGVFDVFGPIPSHSPMATPYTGTLTATLTKALLAVEPRPTRPATTRTC